MAVSNTSSAAVSSGLDVAAIVSGLMTVERVPVDKVDAKIADVTSQISALGTLKGKVSAFQTAVSNLENPGLFSQKTASSSNASAVSASVTSAVATGNYNIQVAQTASGSKLAYSGISATTDLMNLSAFEITVAGGITYTSNTATFSDASVSYGKGDRITFAVNGGSSQTFTLTQTYTDVDDLVTAINAAVDAGSLTDVMATNVGDELVISSVNPLQGIDTASYVSANLAAVTTSQGSGVSGAEQTETASVVFSSMVAGQRVSLNGLTFTASAAVTAAQVASIFDGLVGTTVSAADRMTSLETSDFEAEFGGTLSGDWAASTWSAALSAPGSSTVVFTSEVGDTNVTDLTSTISADAAVSTDNVASNVTATDFKSYLNSLDIGVVASLVTQSSGNQVMTIATTETGADQTLEISGIDTQAGGVVESTLQSARDAFVSVNGLVVQRSTNAIDDVVTGLTINLLAPVDSVDLPVTDGGTPPQVVPLDADSIDDYMAAFDGLSTVVITVANTAADNSDTRIREFVTAYNDLISDYKDQTKRSATASERGVLVNDTFMNTYMNRIRSLYSQGIRLADGTTASMADFGVDLQLDGTMLIDELVLADAISNGLQDKLAAGVVIGRESDADGAATLNSFLRASLRTTGVLTQHIIDYEDRQATLETRKSDLEARMARTEARLYTQYSALDALLMRMQVTSNALASAIDSLTANQNN
jgi:flagellar hook-associated protein 2